MVRIAGIALLFAAVVAISGCGSAGSASPFTPPAPPSGSMANSITALSPTSVGAGSPDFTLTITGTELSPAPPHNGISVAIWSANGSNTSLATSVISNVQLTAVVPAALLRSPVVAQVFVKGGDPNRDTGFTTNSVSVTVLISDSSSFTPAGNMRTARSGHTATLLMNGKVLLAGGGDATAELFDPASNSFALTGSMSTSRYGATATLLASGKVLILGGFGPGVSELPRLRTAELYDPFAGTFSETGSMTYPRVLQTATLLNNGKVLIAGGTTDSGGGGAATASAELYDPSAGVFAVVGSMISDRAQHTATLLPNGRVLLIGGWNGHAADAADDPPWDPLIAELFDPSQENFTATTSMRTTRIGHRAIRLASGEVLILGGIPNPQNLHERLPNPPYAELYDPIAQAFSPVGTFRMSQTGYSGTLLTSGKVLLAGGEDLGHVLGTAELLDPTSGTLTSTGGLVRERQGHTATLLLDGRVLVTGGVDSSGKALAIAELYK